MRFSSSFGFVVRFRWSRFVAAGLAAAVSVSAAGTSVLAGDNENGSAAKLPTPLQASKLRVEAAWPLKKATSSKLSRNSNRRHRFPATRVAAKKAADSRKEIEAAGGSMADFGSLMNLIMTQTSPPALWVSEW
ncbi:MAG UNVERIFIED_CONTAM: hypothetical protein LVR18_51370 [Planctomycetaceae bacterium]